MNRPYEHILQRAARIHTSAVKTEAENFHTKFNKIRVRHRRPWVCFRALRTSHVRTAHTWAHVRKIHCIASTLYYTKHIIFIRHGGFVRFSPCEWVSEWMCGFTSVWLKGDAEDMLTMCKLAYMVYDFISYLSPTSILHCSFLTSNKAKVNTYLICCSCHFWILVIWVSAVI